MKTIWYKVRVIGDKYQNNDVKEGEVMAKDRSFKKVMEDLRQTESTVWAREDLVQIAKQAIDEDNIMLAAHILQAIVSDESEWYDYDPTMGTLSTPTSLRDFSEIECYRRKQ